MIENEILEDIHRFRAEHARGCGYDVHKIFQQVRKGTEKLKTEGWKVVSPNPRETAETSYALRDEPRKKRSLSQQEKMRELYARFDGNKEQCVKAYAEAERSGEVVRKRNQSKMSPDKYAMLLFADMKVKGSFDNLNS